MTDAGRGVCCSISVLCEAHQARADDAAASVTVTLSVPVERQESPACESLNVARIEHIALWTGNIERLADFYARFLGARVGAKYLNAAKGFESRFLTFDDGPRLELMRTSMLQPQMRPAGVHHMGLTHLAFSLGAESRVDELTAMLRDAGFTVEDGPRRTGDGYYESVVLDPDGNRIELTA